MRALLLLAGSVLFLISCLLHPVLLDPGAEATAYHVVAADPLWPAVHVGALAGLALWTAALVWDAPEPARTFWTVALAVWAVVLIFEAAALPRLAPRNVPGLWAWTLAAGYAAAAFDGLGLLALGLAGRRGPGAYRLLTAAAGGLVVAVAPLAYALPALALPALILAAAAWSAFVAWTACLWWPRTRRDAADPGAPAGGARVPVQPGTAGESPSTDAGRRHSGGRP